MDSQLIEINRHLEKAKQTCALISGADSSEKLRSSWEDYLHAFHRTIGRLISFGIEAPETRAWGYKLKNASDGGDEGLTFLREARAHAEHGLTPFADFADPSVRVAGGLVSVGGNSSVTFVGNYVNGKPMGDFQLETAHGRVKQLSGTPLVSLEERDAEISLLPIKSDQKKKSVPVPKTVNGRALKLDDPVSLATESLEALKELVADFTASNSKDT